MLELLAFHDIACERACDFQSGLLRFKPSFWKPVQNRSSRFHLSTLEERALLPHSIHRS